MATLNLPVGAMARDTDGLFKQHIVKEGQEEITEDWLGLQIANNRCTYDVADIFFLYKSL
jgi:glucan phosphorylase